MELVLNTNLVPKTSQTKSKKCADSARIHHSHGLVVNEAGPGNPSGFKLEHGK